MVVDLLAQEIEVPPLSSRQIAAEADAVLAEYAKRFGPITKPPIEIEDVATSVLPLTFGFSDLQSQLGGRVHGAIWFSRQHILIDDALNPDRFPDLLGRYHFTLGHEIAHWQLHRFLFLDEDGHAVLYGDDEMPDVICRKDHYQTRDSIAFIWAAIDFRAAIEIDPRTSDADQSHGRGIQSSSLAVFSSGRVFCG